ncbi:MAG: hypothetical protein V3U09_08520, partial [Thermoplasmata archaeon]
DFIGPTDYSRDFDNDGTQDSLENGDIDNDGIIDYPLGPDVWLNTTIPPSFPQTYAGMDVSLFIGKVKKPPERGEDLIRIYIDSDNSTSTGYSHQGLGADHLIEILGRNGVVRESTLLTHKGEPGTWSWDPIESVELAKHHSKIELAVLKSSLGLVTGDTFVALFEISNWDRSSYDRIQGPMTEVTEDPFVLELVGDVFQSIDGGSTWISKGDAGGGAGYRAIVANYSDYLFVLRKNGQVIGSDDNGTTWTQLTDVGNYQDCVDMTVNGVDNLYVLRTGGEIFESTDSAVNWNSVGDADPSASTGFVGITFDSSDYLYVLVDNGSVYRSADDGSNWSFRGDAGLDTDYVDITADDRDYLYILTSGGFVNESQDSGTSWTYQADVGSAKYTSIEWGYDSFLYVLATTGEVNRSSDGGATWSYRGDVGGASDYSDFTAIIPEYEVWIVPLLISVLVPIGFRSRKHSRKR